MTNQTPNPNTPKDHTCDQPVNEDGRVVLSCNQCYEDIYSEGKYFGYLSALNDVQTTILNLINSEFAILKSTSEADIINNWKSAQLFSKLLDSGVDKLKKSNNQELETIRQKWLLRIEPEKI